MINDPMDREAIKDRIVELQGILDECEVVLNSKDSPFWGILKRTYQAKVLAYKQDCYSAAESEDKSIRNFLGRMEGVEWAVAVVEEDFLNQAKRAKEELRLLKEQLKEAEGIDASVNAMLQTPMNHDPGTL